MKYALISGYSATDTISQPHFRILPVYTHLEAWKFLSNAGIAYQFILRVNHNL